MEKNVPQILAVDAERAENAETEAKVEDEQCQELLKREIAFSELAR